MEFFFCRLFAKIIGETQSPKDKLGGIGKPFRLFVISFAEEITF